MLCVRLKSQMMSTNEIEAKLAMMEPMSKSNSSKKTTDAERAGRYCRVPLGVTGSADDPDPYGRRAPPPARRRCDGRRLILLTRDAAAAARPPAMLP